MLETDDLPFDFEPEAQVAPTPAVQEEPSPEKKKPASLSTAESLSMERDRPGNLIYLFRRGGFLRAYNGSAYLVSCLFRSEYKILRDKRKSGDPYVYLGFPAGKIEEIFSDRGTIEEKEGYVIVSLETDSFPGIPSYEKWLREAKISDKKETELPSEASLPLSGSMRIANAQDIVLRLATYHMESHTMMENLRFLSELISGIEYI